MTCHCSPNPDRMIYLTLCRYRSGMAWAERDAARTGWENTIEDIRSGDLPDVVQVIEFNVVEVSSRDVTEDALSQAGRVSRPAVAAVMSKFDQLIAQLDHDRDYRKHGLA